jgi:phosphatidate cytidylyltransferase
MTFNARSSFVAAVTWFIIPPVVLFAALFFLPQLYWGIFIALLLTLAAWEWAELTGAKFAAALVFSLLFFGFCLGDLLTTLFWVVIAPIWLAGMRKMAGQPTNWGNGILRMLGVFLLFVLWLAFVRVRAYDHDIMGVVVGIAWWSGFIARKFGKISVLLLVFICTVTWFSLQDSGHMSMIVVVALLVTFVWFFPFAVLGMVGNALIVWLKRRACVANSGALLPYGVLDVLGSLLSLLPGLTLFFSAPAMRN